MIVWGGSKYVTQTTFYNMAHRYNPQNDQWIASVSSTSLPDGREEHAASWLGNGMIIWGGHTYTSIGSNGFPNDNPNDYLNTGAIYQSGTVASPGNSLRGRKSSFINLNWQNVFGAGSYNVKRCNPTITGCIPGAIVSTPTINQYSEANDRLSHFYGVEAVNQCGATP